MSRQLLSVILLLQFHACFASRGLVFFHENLNNLPKQELLVSEVLVKEKMHIQGLALNCQLKMNCMEAIKRSKAAAFESDLQSMKTTPIFGTDLKLEKQKEKRTHQDMKMSEARATLESSSPHEYDETNESNDSNEPGENIEVKDYAQPRQKSPIHNEKP